METCSVIESMGLNEDLFIILEKECTEVMIDKELNRIRAYITVWEYENPYIIRTNEDLLRTVREIIAVTYDGIEDFIPTEYHEFID